MSQGRRVLMLSTALGVGGGAEEQVMLLSLGLQRRGWTVKIVSLVPVSPISAELEASGIPISSLGMKRGIPDPRAIHGLWKELRAFQPDVVHAHMPQANLLARVVRPFHHTPVVINTLHNFTMERINGSSGRFLERAHGWTDGLCDLTSVICTPAVDGYVARGALPAHKIKVLYNGVNTADYRCDPVLRETTRRALGLKDEFVWLAIGRFEQAKDYPNLIRAFARVVPSAQQPIRLLICGRGSLENEIWGQIAANGLSEHVSLLGVRRDIPAIMNAADAFVMSSYLEGLPMVLLQAASIGMPVVATDAGGNAEVVVHGAGGYITPPRDSQALAAAMTRILHLPSSERAAMAAFGRAHARRTFDIEIILDQWEVLYRNYLYEKQCNSFNARPVGA